MLYSECSFSLLFIFAVITQPPDKILIYLTFFPCFFLSFRLIHRGTQFLLNWENFRRLYLYVMTENMKQIIRKHKHILLSEDVKKKYDINESDLQYALTLPDLDEVYTRKIHNFPTVNELYQWSSSLNYLSFIKKPMVFINSKDDPLIPEVLLEPIKAHASEWNRLLKNAVIIAFEAIFYLMVGKFSVHDVLCREASEHTLCWGSTRRTFGILWRWLYLSESNHLAWPRNDRNHRRYCAFE